MPEDDQTQPGSSPALDAGAAPSAAPEGTVSPQPSGEGTPPTTQAEQKPWNLPPEQRWEELRRERDEARRQVQELAMRPTSVAQPTQPQADPWEGYLNHSDPATAQFYQQQKRLMEHSLTQREQVVRKEVEQEMTGLRTEVARLNTERFREKHPDIKPGSEEERQIVSYMSGQMDGVRHPLESAKRNALYDRLEAENRALKAKQSSVGSKVAANISESSSGIPAGAGLPGKPGDWRENVRQAHRKGGDLASMLNAAGASRAQPEG